MRSRTCRNHADKQVSDVTAHGCRLYRVCIERTGRVLGINLSIGPMDRRVSMLSVKLQRQRPQRPSPITPT